MSKKTILTGPAEPSQSEQTRATAEVPAKEPSVHTVFRSLVSKLANGDHNYSSPPMQAPLVEVEHEGIVYSIFCRKKQACPAFVELSPRERDIARMIASGLPNKTIAASLEISEWTVSTHLRRIFAKLGVCCRAAMVSKWLESHNACKWSTSPHDLVATRVSPSEETSFGKTMPVRNEPASTRSIRLKQVDLLVSPRISSPVTATGKTRLD
jgi:DNA-binding CsgD family transcriptional regulator